MAMMPWMNTKGKKSNFNAHFPSKSLKGLSYDQIMIQQAVDHEMSPEYCRYCGKEILRIGSDNLSESEHRWQRENNAHIKCHQQHLYHNRGK